MKKTRNRREGFSVQERFRYWFDNRMSKGSLGLIRGLIIASVILALFTAWIIILCGFNEKGETASVFWDSIANLINAWMPSFGEGSLGYVVLMSLSALSGLLFTSVLIGIITSAIEEKIQNLKKGNSLVLEKDHIVVLGFYPGEFTLLQQLILAAAGNPACVILAEDMDREEMEQALQENLEIPKNFRIICRTADITDPASLEKCSVETCKTVIVSPTDDMKTTKAVLAVSALLQEKGVPEISVNAIISRERYRFPPSIAEANNITTLQTNSVMAKMIAHACTQNGLSETFREIFNFEGSEFYLIDIPGIQGIPFNDLMLRLNGAVPVGVFRDGKTRINPPGDYVFEEDDRVLVFSEESASARLESPLYAPVVEAEAFMDHEEEEVTDTVIIGANETLAVILHELPENVSQVFLVDSHGILQEDRDELDEIAAGRNLSLKYIQGNVQSAKFLLGVARMARHIIVLSNHEADPEKADMESIFLLLNLRDIRSRYELDFNITVEMQKEHNQKLVVQGDHTDFLVASSMSSLILAQLAESPELQSVFREILSNEGNELYIKNAGLMRITGSFTVRYLRQIMLNQGYILLGRLDPDKTSQFNLPLDDTITLTKDDYLIVLGES